MESFPNLKPSLPADETPELTSTPSPSPPVSSQTLTLDSPIVFAALVLISFVFCPAGWFSWDSIHETERSALREFFDASSYSRSPKIYKAYRDFIISKHREDPSRKLTFTDVRKSLVGDVSLVRKVFLCLESWGLINFNVSSPEPAAAEHEDELGVRVEDGVPIGVKVVVAPNSLKPMPVPPPPAAVGSRLLGDGNGFSLPPLASYSDVFGDLKRAEGLVCGNCKVKCDSKYYESAKDNCVICTICFEKGLYGESKTAEDFSLNERKDKNSDQGDQWTEAETLLLLESVLKHGDDWDLVAQSVHTKTKSECVSRLIEMPFGELMLGSHGKASSKDIENVTSTAEEMKPTKDDPHETDRMEYACHEEIIHKEKGERNGDAGQSPLPKKRRIDSSHPDRPLMKQVALISDMVGPKVKAAAVGGALSTLCTGNPLLEQIFYSEDVVSADGLLFGNSNMELDRPSCSVDLEIKDNVGPPGGDENAPEMDVIPLPLRMRAAVATSLGTAAAHARLMANHEEREMEFLIASVIETQLKKLQSKVKHFEELEHIMEEEHDELQELKECVVAERMDILKKIVSDG